MTTSKSTAPQKATRGIAQADFAFTTLRDRPQVEPPPELGQVLVAVLANVPMPARECF